MKKETYFFSHDCNARNDEKILMLRADHGMEGYGIYWALIEMMFETSETCLSHDKVKGIAASYSMPITKLQDTINTCITEGLFVSDGNVFWSESLIRRKEKYHSMIKRKSEGGKKAMKKRWNKDSISNDSDNLDITNLKDSCNEVITSDNKGKKSKGNKIKENKVFIPPTLQDVIDYCNERENGVDAKRFYDSYAVADWIDSKGDPVKNWKQKIINVWENNSNKPKQQKPTQQTIQYTGFNDYYEED